MKRTITIYCLGFLGLFFSYQAAAQKPTCETNSYLTEVIKEKQLSETCTEYEIKVSYDGTRSFGLSHYSIGIPCGEIKEVSNSENWKQVFGKDPTTGVYGLKIDNISGFGEGGADSFIIKFTWCADNSCQQDLAVVSYKAGKCVHYDTLSNDSDPNPDPDPDPDPDPACSTLLANLQKQNLTCASGNDGQLRVVIQEGQEPFVFSWSTGANTASIQNLTAGIYAVTIQDANGNSQTITEEISAPSPIAVTETAVNPSCSGKNNGSIALTVTGGTEPYTFAWSNGLSAQNLNSLPSGFYTVTIKDAAGCSAVKTIVLTNDVLISAEALFTRPSCTQANGSIDITPVGGVSPYTYLWSNGATTQDLQNVAAGNYLVTITDAGGCLTRKIYTLPVNNTLILQFVAQPTSCSGDNSGAINLTIFGGTAPYTIKWLDGPTTEDRSGLTTGTYQVDVKDASGCTAQLAISVNKQPLQVTSIVNQPTCSQNLGSITVTPKGGVSPYTYSWSNSETGDSIDELTGGNYTVTITDALGCSETQSYFIVPPTILVPTGVISKTQCGNEGSYSIDLAVTGGKSPYAYLWSTGATSEDISGLTAGIYSVDVKDGLGCTLTKEFIIDPASLSWSCLITPPTASIICGSVGNLLSTELTDATIYQWTVTSTDNNWAITSGSNHPSVVYTAGSTGSTATFTLSVTKNGCTETCSYTTPGSCVEKDNTGGGDPSSGDPCSSPTNPTVTTTVAAEETETEVTDNPGAEEAKIKFKMDVYPNPFKEKLNFEWLAPTDDNVQIEILDKFGNRLTVVFEGTVNAGQRYLFDWSAVGLRDHIYFYRYTSSQDVDYGKLFRK